ncbi:hypothetical protein B0T17DRAFT_642172 [Bombardia bombarda]|uniref:Uncharacterized protein n=1 Tax=Bombardia bombarda TaxID=252184 RepID=A0AA40C1T2_9PEZI|nr:hypothetical protein B0T17DRAFT_642172 [Bombardia bombarda]
MTCCSEVRRDYRLERYIGTVMLAKLGTGKETIHNFESSSPQTSQRKKQKDSTAQTSILSFYLLNPPIVATKEQTEFVHEKLNYVLDDIGIAGGTFITMAKGILEAGVVEFTTTQHQISFIDPYYATLPRQQRMATANTTNGQGRPDIPAWSARVEAIWDRMLSQGPPFTFGRLGYELNREGVTRYRVNLVQGRTLNTSMSLSATQFNKACLDVGATWGDRSPSTFKFMPGILKNILDGMSPNSETDTLMDALRQIIIGGAVEMTVHVPDRRIAFVGWNCMSYSVQYDKYTPPSSVGASGAQRARQDDVVVTPSSSQSQGGSNSQAPRQNDTPSRPTTTSGIEGGPASREDQAPGENHTPAPTQSPLDIYSSSDQGFQGTTVPQETQTVMLPFDPTTDFVIGGPMPVVIDGELPQAMTPEAPQVAVTPAYSEPTVPETPWNPSAGVNPRDIMFGFGFGEQGGQTLIVDEIDGGWDGSCMSNDNIFCNHTPAPIDKTSSTQRPYPAFIMEPSSTQGNFSSTDSPMDAFLALLNPEMRDKVNLMPRSLQQRVVGGPGWELFNERVHLSLDHRVKAGEIEIPVWTPSKHLWDEWRSKPYLTTRVDS